MSTRSKTQKMSIPVNLPDTIYAVEMAIDPSEETGNQVVCTFRNTDGTITRAKGSLPTITTAGFNLTLTAVVEDPGI